MTDKERIAQLEKAVQEAHKLLGEANLIMIKQQEVIKRLEYVNAEYDAICDKALAISRR